MDYIKSFLENSTIHGLFYISTTRKVSRVIWILIVILAFSFAGVMINLSFNNWADNPIKTTIKTQPITKLTLPKVTVCPPKNTFTNLNYDLMLLENMTFDRDTRNELIHYVVEMIQNNAFSEVMSNLSLLEEENRYYNWYHGFSDILLPFWGQDSFGCKTLDCLKIGLRYNIFTKATSGMISTRKYAEKFYSSNVEKNFINYVKFIVPEIVREDDNIKFHFEIDKNSLEGFEKFHGLLENLNTTTTCIKNYTDLSAGLVTFTSYRDISYSDLIDLDVPFMPGFRIKWYFSEDLVPDYNDVFNSSAFKR